MERGGKTDRAGPPRNPRSADRDGTAEYQQPGIKNALR